VIAVAVALTIAALMPRSAETAAGRGSQAGARVYAIEFATLPAFSVSSLVAGADRGRTLDIAMMIWAIELSDGRLALVDAGFHRDKFIERWKPAGYVTPAAALSAALGRRADEVTDVILSHVHWDHADGVDLFPRARVWIQRAEFEHHVDQDGSARDRAIDPAVASALHAVAADGRLRLVDGDDREVLPGVRVHTGGRHTFASQYVTVATRRGLIVLASDNAYLYENLERRVPIAQTLDAASNLAAIDRMLAFVSRDLTRIVPGHDPSVLTRFPGHRGRSVRVD
jgi:glyoxylase-like metal-dependent hydrolase (beta-lactamase superfamily II)